MYGKYLKGCQWTLISLFILLSACGEKAKPIPPKPNVQILTLKSQPIALTKEYIGITQSIASVDIRARVKGFLTNMNFIEGKPVKKNQLLFRIDPSSFQAKLDLTKGQLASSIARKKYEEVQYFRFKNLVAKGDVSKSDFDRVSAQFAESEGAVQTASAQVEEAKINLGYTSMYSPIDGVISHQYVDVGNLVGGGENTLLTNVVQLNPIYVEFSPSVDDYHDFLRYRKNKPFKAVVRFPQNNDLVFKGKVDFVNNQADVSTSTILMRATIDNPEMLLLPGIYVNIAITLEENYPVLLVPIKAVTQTQGQYSLYLLNAKNQVESRIINVLDPYKDNYMVTSGVKEGDKVIINNLQKIRPGMEVNII